MSPWWWAAPLQSGFEKKPKFPLDTHHLIAYPLSSQKWSALSLPHIRFKVSKKTLRRLMATAMLMWEKPVYHGLINTRGFIPLTTHVTGLFTARKRRSCFFLLFCLSQMKVINNSAYCEVAKTEDGKCIKYIWIEFVRAWILSHSSDDDHNYNGK